MKTKEQKILIVANWKMNPGRLTEAVKVASEIKKGVLKYKHVDVVLCPSFTHISTIAKQTGKGNVFLGAQNIAWSEQESLTGEVSGAMLQDLGVSYVIVGHSERRAYGETNTLVAQKIHSALKRGITPILCVGEDSRDEKGEYLKKVEEQLKESLVGIKKNVVEKIVIAYEPLWAIGKGSVRSATGSEIQEMSILIRRTISDMYEFKNLPKNTIVYGGSVGNKKDIISAVQEGGMNGCLVGRASLSAKTFVPLVEEADRLVM